MTSPEAAVMIREPLKYILKSDEELAADVNNGLLRGQPYWDPVLRNSKAKKREFLLALHRARLLTWRRRVHSRVGCFVVRKKDGMQRRVLDARWTNRMCRPPPLSRLAVPSAIGRIGAGRELLHAGLVDLHAMGASGPHSSPPRTVAMDTDNADLFGFSVDLADGFYQFKCEKMASFRARFSSHRARDH